MVDKVVCTVSKRKEITPASPWYELFRAVLRESNLPCQYFRVVHDLKKALVDHAIEVSEGRKGDSARLLHIHRNHLRYIEHQELGRQQTPRKGPNAERIEQMNRLTEEMEELKRRGA